MKRRLILLVVVIALIAGFGALLHSPPSIIDAVTGATPKAKKAAQSSAQLEGSYIFCMNPLLDKLSDEDIREQLKAFVTGKTDSIRTDTELSFDIYVSETDYALIRYADSLCERLNDAGAENNTAVQCCVQGQSVGNMKHSFLKVIWSAQTLLKMLTISYWTVQK